MDRLRAGVLTASLASAYHTTKLVALDARQIAMRLAFALLAFGEPRPQTCYQLLAI